MGTLSICLKSLLVQADLYRKTVPEAVALTAKKDQSPMVTFWKRFGVLRRIPVLFKCFINSCVILNVLFT